MKHLLQEFRRYLGVGGIAFMADFTMFTLLSSGFKIHYLAAFFIAFLFGSLVNYKLSVSWVFVHRAIPEASMEISLFIIIGVITLGLSFILMSWFVENLHLHYLFAKCLTTGITLIMNFAGRKAFLFTPRKQPSQVHAVTTPAD